MLGLKGSEGLGRVESLGVLRLRGCAASLRMTGLGRGVVGCLAGAGAGLGAEGFWFNFSFCNIFFVT